jgi:hypothetical protein
MTKEPGPQCFSGLYTPVDGRWIHRERWRWRIDVSEYEIRAKVWWLLWWSALVPLREYCLLVCTYPT